MTSQREASANLSRTIKYIDVVDEKAPLLYPPLPSNSESFRRQNDPLLLISRGSRSLKRIIFLGASRHVILAGASVRDILMEPLAKHPSKQEQPNDPHN